MRTSRFFPEADDRDDVRSTYADLNLKVNELLYRRVDLEDVVTPTCSRWSKRRAIGFGRYVISATTPFTARRSDQASGTTCRQSFGSGFPDLDVSTTPARLADVPGDRAGVRERASASGAWLGPALRLPPRARRDSATDEDPRSALARSIGAKGYHAVSTGVYTVR